LESSPHAEVLKHVFASAGPKAKPVYVDVNGRKGRRAVCALYADAMRYEVLDLDAAIEEEEVDVEEEGEEIGSEEEEEVDTEN
jgi:anaphase-promoting complex subunit 4